MNIEVITGPGSYQLLVTRNGEEVHNQDFDGPVLQHFIALAGHNGDVFTATLWATYPGTYYPPVELGSDTLTVDCADDAPPTTGPTLTIPPTPTDPSTPVETLPFTGPAEDMMVFMAVGGLLGLIGVGCLAFGGRTDESRI